MGKCSCLGQWDNKQYDKIFTLKELVEKPLSTRWVERNDLEFLLEMCQSILRDCINSERYTYRNKKAASPFCLTIQWQTYYC